MNERMNDAVAQPEGGRKGGRRESPGRVADLGVIDGYTCEHWSSLITHRLAPAAHQFTRGLSVDSGAAWNEDVHLAAAAVAAAASSSVQHQTIGRPSPAADSAAYRRSASRRLHRRRRLAAAGDESSPPTTPLSMSSSSSLSFDAGARRSAEAASLSSSLAAAVGGRAPAGQPTSAAQQNQQIDACWNFTVGDERKRELHSPRLTSTQPQQQQQQQQRHPGPHAVYQTAPPASRQQLLQHLGSAAVQRRTHYPNRTDCVRLLTGTCCIRPPSPLLPSAEANEQVAQSICILAV
jgi:hypothetical protein